MTRLVIFLAVLVGLVLSLILFSYNDIPVNNTKFDFKKVQEAYQSHTELIHELTTPKEKTSEVEVVVTEYAPVVELSTPELESGHKLFNQCISCHGKGGEGKASQKAPFIGGQYDWYIEKQLTDMSSGERVNASMATIVKALSPQDIKDLAAYVSKLPWKKQVADTAPAEAAPAK